MLVKIFSLSRFFYRKKIHNFKAVGYFNEIPNVGDALNEDLFRFITGSNISKPSGIRFIKHYLAVGSVLGAMNKNSIVWGSGLISVNTIDTITEIGDIRALRGSITKKALEDKFRVKLEVPLGDPALLMPNIYPASIDKTYKFGIVPHYVDENHSIVNIIESIGGCVINVSLPVNKFIEQLTKCKVILSSSMHGLILADAYDIPNVRLVLSENIVGGDYKFNDYYSTTDIPNESQNKCEVNENVTSDDIFNFIEKARVKKYIYSKEILLKSFPI
jgi:pyruvyltransferase